MDDELTVDDIVSGLVAESLGPGVLPTAAILIVETVTEDSRGLRYLKTGGLSTWQALGILRSATIRVELEDRAGWIADDEEDDDG
jgi:hypothetical protein